MGVGLGVAGLAFIAWGIVLGKQHIAEHHAIEVQVREPHFRRRHSVQGLRRQRHIQKAGDAP